MLRGIHSAIYGEVNVSVEKCVEIRGDYVEKPAKLFYFCHLKKLVRPEPFGPYYVHTVSYIFIQGRKSWYVGTKPVAALARPQPVLSPSSILPPITSAHAFSILASKKFGVLFNHVIIPALLTFFLKKCVSLQARNLKLREVGECL